MSNPSTQTHQVTDLLAASSQGDKEALDKLMPLVYDELRRIARQHLRRERAGHTLQTNALVNEAYLRLVDQRSAQWQNRAQFFGVAAQLMRRILVDHARSHNRLKRAGDAKKVSLDEADCLAGAGNRVAILTLGVREIRNAKRMHGENCGTALFWRIEY
jgi:RNA polymerase sigma factor (TIGR02999 family)